MRTLWPDFWGESMQKSSGDSLLVFLRAASKYLIIVTIVAWPTTYLMRLYAEELHKLHTTGIVTNASVKEVRSGSRWGYVTHYNADLTWTDGQGKVHNWKHADISREYGQTFISADRVTVKTLPIKYLAEDPNKFVLYLDPAKSEEAHALKLLMGEIAAGAGLLFIPLFFVRRSLERQRKQANAGAKARSSTVSPIRKGGGA